MSRFWLCCLLTALSLPHILGDDSDHHYNFNEEVVLWINRIGPYRNPSETYMYYKLPFCKPEGNHHTTHKYADLGEILQGNEMIESGMHMYFQTNVPKTTLCTQTLTQDSVAKFSKAVAEQYWYQFFLDDLPVWGMVGDSDPSKTSTIYTHKKLEIAYNDDRIIEVNLTSQEPLELTAGQVLEFTYSVTWKKSSKPFGKRFTRYLDYSFFEHQIHWFSIFNSFMMVLFLCGLVSLILLRTLKNDFVRYREIDHLDSTDIYDRFEDESGWKQVHGDVFRRPKRVALYCALYGIGMQLLTTAVAVIISAIVFKLYVEPSEVLHTAVAFYAFTNAVSGYFSAKQYMEFFYPNPVKKVARWGKVMIISWGFLPFVAFAVVSFLNLLALYYGTKAVVPFRGLFYVFLSLVFICFPLCFLGTLIARQYAARNFKGYPVRVNALPRQIPPAKWFTKHLFLLPMTGWLPFASIFIETYFVLSSFWNYKFYYVFGFSLLVLFILCSVVACVTVFAVYLLLSHEDYRWHWAAMYGGGSVGGYVFIYSLYYFLTKTNMTGVMQTAYYFGYMGVFCLGLAIMCGTVGSVASSLFVKRIYRNIHVD